MVSFLPKAQPKRNAFGQLCRCHHVDIWRLNRCEFHDILRMPDEVVMANVGRELLLSHPQSDLWLTEQHVAELVLAFRSNKGNVESSASLPDWLIVSTGAGRLMLSDQRNGRWVLLGDDHVSEFERRLFSLRLSPESVPQPTHVVDDVLPQGSWF
jgi:hypothetical protein